MIEINKIYNDDFISILSQLPDNLIDLTVTSPPYDNLRLYKGYKFDFNTIADQLYRVTKQGGVLVWVVADATVKGSETGTSFRQALYFKDIGFNLHDTMIWIKTNPFPANVRYQQDFEFMFVLTKGKCGTFNPLREPKSEREIKSILDGTTHFKSKTLRNKDGSITKIADNKKAIKRYEASNKRIDKVMSNVWKIHSGYMISTKDKISFNHPASFPETLAKNHILSWSNENDIVLDPMCGSGTTCKMAKLLNRQYLGIDVSGEYCDILNERLELVN